MEVLLKEFQTFPNVQFFIVTLNQLKPVRVVLVNLIRQGHLKKQLGYFNGNRDMNILSGRFKKVFSGNIFVRLYKYYIIDSIMIVKKEGFKALLRKRGWKVFAVVIGYYVIRDTIFYIIVPYLIAQNIL